MAGRRAGESSRCEDPAPTVGIAGRPLRGMPHRPSFALTRASTGTANGGITTQRTASLRPPRNGRIGFRPPYPKKKPRQKARRESIPLLGVFPLLDGKLVLIKRSNLSKTVAAQRLCEGCSRESHFYQLARFAIAFSVGETPSAASALPAPSPITHRQPCESL